MEKKKKLAQKIAVALICAASLPAAGHAINDFEANQTYLAGGCAAANGPGRNHSCAAGGGYYRGQSCSSNNGRWDQGCAAAPSYGCAAQRHGCAAAPSHGCGSHSHDQGQYQRDPSYFQPSHNASHQNVYGQPSYGSPNQNPHGQTSYTGTSTGPGPNDGYPATPRGTSSTIYSSNPNAVDASNVNRR